MQRDEKIIVALTGCSHALSHGYLLIFPAVLLLLQKEFSIGYLELGVIGNIMTLHLRARSPSRRDDLQLSRSQEALSHLLSRFCHHSDPGGHLVRTFPLHCRAGPPGCSRKHLSPAGQLSDHLESQGIRTGAWEFTEQPET